MAQERQFPTSEIKAGLKLAKEFYEIDSNDTDYVKGIKSLLKDISSALEAEDLSQMLHCNHVATEKYGDVLVKDCKGFFRRIHIRDAAKLGVCMNALQLWLIGESLIDVIKASKARERESVIYDVAGEYVCDKVFDALTSHQTGLFSPSVTPYPQKL